MRKFLYFLVGAGMLLATAPAYAQTVPTAPSANVSGSTSHNWSGYVAAGSTYTGVNGTWTIPTATAATGTNLSADAAWVGIGGFSTHDLIQAGTEAEVQSNGSVIYQAWYEALPAGQVQVPVKVHAGDSITVNLTETSTNVWHLSFTNNTTGASYQTDINYTSSHNSADWIEEMPLGQFGNTSAYVPLDMFGSIPFTNAYAVNGNGIQTLTAANAQPMTMMASGITALATPSSIGSDGESFSVARTSASAASQTQVEVVRGRRSFTRGGDGISSFQQGTPVRYQIQQIQILRQMPLLVQEGRTIHVQFIVRRG